MGLPIDGDALRAARSQAGLTQHQLATLLDVAGSERVRRWEKGGPIKSPTTFRALAAAVGVAPADLLPAGKPSFRALRFVAGLSIEDLAEAVGVTAVTMRRWESRPQRSVDPSTVDRLAAALGASPDDVEAALTQ